MVERADVKSDRIGHTQNRAAVISVRYTDADFFFISAFIQDSDSADHEVCNKKVNITCVKGVLVTDHFYRHLIVVMMVFPHQRSVVLHPTSQQSQKACVQWIH